MSGLLYTGWDHYSATYSVDHQSQRGRGDGRFGRRLGCGLAVRHLGPTAIRSVVSII
jgi:hypothetical protein